MAAEIRRGPESMPQSSPLSIQFFERDVLTVARDLIGMELHWHGCSGVIIETEAYAAENDPACHTASRPSARAFMANHEPGTAYVYFNYGMYWLFNLLVKGGPNDGLILIRAIDPFKGIDQMLQRRQGRKHHQLCSGPGKLTVALGITGEHHGLPMVGPQRKLECYLAQPNGLPARKQILADSRVGISKATELPWRFLLADHPGVSVPYGKALKTIRK